MSSAALAAVPQTRRAGPSGNRPALSPDFIAEVKRRYQAFLREHKDTAAFSQANIGRKLGYQSGGAVLSSWVKGDYKGDNDRVTQKVAQFLDVQELSEAYGVDAGEYADTTSALEIDEAISLAVATRGFARITGTTGSGKTHALLAYSNRNDAILLTAGNGMSTHRSVIAQLWAAMFKQPLDARAPLADAQASVISTLRTAPRPIAVDEFDLASTRAAEMLRCIADGARVSLIVAGERLRPRSGAFEGRIIGEVSLDADYAFTAENVSLVAAAGGLSDEVIEATLDKLVEEARTAGGFRRVRNIRVSAQSIAGKGQPIKQGHILEAIRRLRRARGGAR